MVWWWGGEGKGGRRRGGRAVVGGGFYMYCFPINIFSLLISFSETTILASNPKSGSRCSLPIFSKISRTQSMDKFYWFDLLMFTTLLTSFHYQDPHSKFASYLENWQWLLGLTVFLDPSTAVGLHNAISLGNVKTHSAPFRSCLLPANKAQSPYFSIWKLGKFWPPLLDLVPFIYLYALNALFKLDLSVTWTILSFRLCYF